ncbi:MAG: tRNA (adenosine(37)-N6)-threonylcarbamoyltransferase complex dimerization subunit type 1 TsaB, partial [Myxococcales bacterium]|nr:tRNA (adenosine(37)-N6)-threonylcarbamoyltransferase complex dimerization subunit type 1 TsaB [Myxococcales bacterium]
TSGSWMLCFDASAPRTCVALGRVDEEQDILLVSDDEDDGSNQSSARLHLRLAAVLEQAGIRPRDLAAIACGRGPGTFTGSRVAVATAKGLALGLSIVVVPVSTLAALAASALAEVGDADAPVLALLDARRSQVYGACFEFDPDHRTPRLLGEESVTELAALLKDIDLDARQWEQLRAYGPGCGPYAEQMPEALRARSTLAPGPSAAGLWRAAVGALRAGDAVDPDAFTVTYLRESYAEMGINKPKRPAYRSPFV